MGITFNTNLAALGAQRNIGIAANNSASSLSKLSSGSRVPQAKDDAAGLSIGSKLKAEVAGLTQAANNAGQGISLLQIADGALSTMGDILQRMKALAVQSSSGQLADADRSLLNQEFTNLRSEIDRVAALTNFNGTTLLAGSTTVTSDINGLTSYNGTTNDSSATNLIGSGFDSITFDNDFGDGAVKIAYNGTTRVMTVTDLETGVAQGVTLSSSTIANGATETVSFGDIGVTIKVNSQFSKSTDISGTNTAKVTANPSNTAYTVTSSLTATSLVVTAGSTGITAVSLNDTDAGAFGTDRIFGSDLAGSVAIVSGTQTAVTLGNLALTVNGQLHTFTSSTSADFTAIGNKDYAYSDGQGNSFTLRIAVGTAATGVVSGSVAIAAGTTGGTIEATGTNRPTLYRVGESGTAGNEYNFGSFAGGRVTIDASTASSAVLSLSDGTTTFLSSNTTGGGANVDLTTTGIKTVTLASTNVAATANTIQIQFNVTRAFTNGDVGEIVLQDFGQVVAANSSTSASTSFDFKVGTGVTSNDSISFSLSSATTSALGINSDTIDTAANANTAITNLGAAITAVSSRRADVGAAQSRLQFASASINVAIENVTAAQSSLLDVDVSSEITKFTSQNVLVQAGVSLLAQANQQPALLLRLLQ